MFVNRLLKRQLKYHFKKRSSTLCSPLWGCEDMFMFSELLFLCAIHTLINSACRESTVLCVSSAQWQCWTQKNNYFYNSYKHIFIHWTLVVLSYHLHICLFPFWCWQKRWPERWSSVDPVAEQRRSCWTLSRRRNAGQDVGNSTSDRPDERHGQVRLQQLIFQTQKIQSKRT